MPVFEDEHKCEEFSEWWIFSYGDLVTLLLVFFIMLFSFCKTDIEKFKSVAESFKPVPPGTPFFLDGRESVLEAIVQRLESSEIATEIFVTVDQRGVVVSFRDTALFESGAAELTARARQTLRVFVAYLFGLPNDVIVEGHTDDQRIASSRFPSNWELSSARASAVARFFEGEGVEGSRMQVLGYAEFRPRFRNDTPEQRALNRRVDVILKPQ
jgi:chemotaxis protein MotB